MPERILIIDDDVEILAMLGRYLSGRGYATETARGGAEAMARLASLRPALVLCDLRMPGMNGLELLAALKGDHPDLPVIVVSGTGDLGDAIQAIKLGASDFVTKPIEDLGVLDHAVGRTLEQARLLAENRAYRLSLEATNARLSCSLRQLEDDEAHGRKIQFALLPPPQVRFGDYQCSRYLATSAFLSGDFIDYFTIDQGHFGFYMADVSGHGVGSAVITVLLKSHVGRYLENSWRYGDQTILDPADLLAALNRDFLNGLHGKYLTMFYGVVATASAQIAFANGGQFPFPLLFDGEDVSEIAGRSPPVGLFTTARYSTGHVSISTPFALRLFSDGVLEQLELPRLDGRKGALRHLAAEADRDAGDLAHVLGLDTPRPLADDASVLSIRRLGGPHG